MIKPKHHYVCHLPGQLRSNSFLLGAFTLERKHQEVKAAASNTDNTIEFEMSSLARVHVAELRQQAKLECDDGLRGARARHEPLAAHVADSLEFRGLRIHANDIVFSEDEPLPVRC